MNSQEWNPRYLAYCKAHGFKNDPEGILEHDRSQGPVMLGFQIWISQRINVFRKAYPTYAMLFTDESHDIFSLWLFNEGNAPLEGVI